MGLKQKLKTCWSGVSPVSGKQMKKMHCFSQMHFQRSRESSETQVNRRPSSVLVLLNYC